MLQVHIDSARLQAAFRVWAASSKRGAPEQLKYVAKGFVRRVISLTPPSQGNADSRAKLSGEEAIIRDLNYIFEAINTDEWKGFYDQEGRLKIVPVDVNAGKNRRGATTVDYIHFLKRSEMAEFHQKMRSKSDGSVRRVQRGNLIGRKKSDSNDTAFVTTRDLKWYKKQAIKNVGELAAGWNKAAQDVGYNPPQWIARHGNARGSYVVSINDGLVEVLVTNAVPFVRAVKNFENTVNTALEYQAQALEKQSADFHLKNARKAGLV